MGVGEKNWVYLFKDNDNAIFSVTYKDILNEGEVNYKHIKGRKSLIQFVEKNEFEIIEIARIY